MFWLCTERLPHLRRRRNTTDAQVHIISTPFAARDGYAKAEQVEQTTDDSEHGTAHCYNPNTDCAQAGAKGWMETWFGHFQHFQ